MRIIKKKILRKIYLSYEDISNLFNLPSKSGFNMYVGIGEIRIWKDDRYNLRDWEVEISEEEFNEKIGLLKNETIIDDNYVAFRGYYLVIETTLDNLHLIDSIINKKRGLFRKILNPFLDKKSLNIGDWILIKNKINKLKRFK